MDNKIQVKKNTNKSLISIKDFNFIIKYIINLSNQSIPTIVFFKKILKILLDYSNCNIIELWMQLNNDNGNNNFKVMKISDKSFNLKITLLNENNLFQILKEIYKKRSYSSKPYKKYDILLTGNIKKTFEEYFKNNTIKNNIPKIYNLDKKYNSILIIPLYVGDKKIGFIQLINEKENFFKLSEVKYYRTLTQNLGLIISNQQAQVALQERVKELTCLYGIANAAEGYNTSLDEVLKKTVMLLPSAWQYPEITKAQIIFDRKKYKSDDFKKIAHKQSADIIINDIKRGSVEVVYTEKEILLDEGPFLFEERDLINTIAKEISLIIERKLSEIEKKKLEDQLRHADRLATIGQLASGVAHELNEPLCNILGFAQLIQKDSELPESIKKDLEKILNASIHAREIVRKLLIFSRQMPTNKVRINLNQIIKDGLYFLRSRCEKESIELSMSLEENIPDFNIDPSQLNQVITNLVVNAIQAMPDGGKLNVKTLFNDSRIYLIVEDTGIGMDDKILKQIFIPFFTTKDVGQGTGLGLPVVHGIVSSYGGIIKIDSKVGKGSKFEIQFPITYINSI